LHLVTDPGPLFDQYAADYEQTIDQAIQASGENVLYFAALRARMLADATGPQVERRRFAILDFGCGTGNLLREVAARFSASVLTGADLSEQSIAQARGRTSEPRITYAVTPPDRLAFNDASFDLIYAQGVFHHIEPDRRVYWATEIRRVLKPGGNFFMFEHNPLNLVTVRVVRRIPFDEGVVLLRAGMAVKVMRDAGFQTVAAPHYYFFFPHVLRALRPLERFLTRFALGAQYVIKATA
jgi:ubiquinone/menaquinone biosynthesis C-methylase UbiE